MSQYKDTKYGSLEDTLNAIGKAAFVRFYYDFKDTTIPTDVLAAKILRESPRARSSRQGFRIPRARHIFAIGQEIDALKIIIASEKVDPDAIELAKCILDRELQKGSQQEEKNEESNFIESINNDLIYSVPICFEYDNNPRRPRVSTSVFSKRYYRSRTVAKNALSKASYLCEVDPRHRVFVRKNSNINYTEPHHLVPLYVSDHFPNVDLDREQNVVSLCSECHNWLHYGSNIDQILKPLYDKRKELLEAVGISITYEDLKKLY
jgi:hypothetical protein